MPSPYVRFYLHPERELACSARDDREPGPGAQAARGRDARCSTRAMPVAADAQATWRLSGTALSIVPLIDAFVYGSAETTVLGLRNAGAVDWAPDGAMVELPTEVLAGGSCDAARPRPSRRRSQPCWHRMPAFETWPLELSPERARATTCASAAMTWWLPSRRTRWCPTRMVAARLDETASSSRHPHSATHGDRSTSARPRRRHRRHQDAVAAVRGMPGAGFEPLVPPRRFATIRDPEAFLAALDGAAAQVVPAGQRPVAVGIGVPGPLDAERGVVETSPNVGWQ